MDESMNEQSGRVSVGRQSGVRAVTVAEAFSNCANVMLLEAASVDRPGWKCLDECPVGRLSSVPKTFERGVPSMPRRFEVPSWPGERAARWANPRHPRVAGRLSPFPGVGLEGEVCGVAAEMCPA